MSLVKPIIATIPAFDATLNHAFTFTSNGGDQVVANRITIRNNNTNAIVYQNTLTTYILGQTVIANELANNMYYNVYFNTFNTNGDMSEDSNVIPFRCIATPVMSITNMPLTNIINASSYTFNSTYSQVNGELLNYVIYTLYDLNGIELANSGKMYSTDAPPISFSYLFSGLDDNTSYKLEVSGVTVNGMTFTTGLITFTVSYYSPVYVGLLELDNKCDDGYNQITSNIITSTAETVPTNPYYLSDFTANTDNYINWDEWFTIPNTDVISEWLSPYAIDLSEYTYYAKWYEGFELTADFTMMFWMTANRIEDFLTNFNSVSNAINVNFVREIPFGEVVPKDYFEVRAYVGGVEQVYQHSNYINLMNNTSKVFVYIRKVGNTWDLVLEELVATETNVVEWNVVSNVEWGKLTDFKWSSMDYPIGIQKTEYANNIDSIFPITNIEIKWGYYDNMYITRNVTDIYTSSEYPTFDSDTILDCSFTGNTNAGNVDFTLEQLDAIKIKRRVSGEFDWITIYNIPITTMTDLNISKQDSMCPSGYTYEYALVPVLNGAEGDYITKSLDAVFNGTFISDVDNIFKLYSNVQFGVSSIQLVGQLQPIGLKYPITVKNSIVNYDSGSIGGSLYGYTFDETRQIDRKDVVTQTNDFKMMTKNHKPKFIKDWNGNIALVRIVGNIDTTYNSSYGNGVVDVSCNWVEQGKWNNQSDLVKNGLVEE